MKKLFVLIVCALFAFTGFSQTKIEVKRNFSDTEKQIIRYRELAQKGWDNNNEKLALLYIDSVRTYITGSYVGGHTFTTIANKTISLQNLKKPVFMTISATWCKPCIAEIPALNKIAEEYADQITFVALFPETKDKLAEHSKQYNSFISIVPSEKKDEDDHTVDISGFRHITGYPTNYLITLDKEITGYSQGASAPTTYFNEKGEAVTITKERAYELNYARLKEEAEHLLSSWK